MRSPIIIILLIIAFSASARARDYTISVPPKENSPCLIRHREPPVTIDRLKARQKYIITVESNGCFHHSDLFLTISKNEDGYFATFKMRGKIEGKKVSHIYKRIMLSESQVDSIRSFEKRLIQLSKQASNCTTVDTYQLTIGGASNSFRVDNCDWQGISNLVGVLFRSQGGKRTTLSLMPEGLDRKG